jgi:hypothetical protein
LTRFEKINTILWFVIGIIVLGLIVVGTADFIKYSIRPEQPPPLKEDEIVIEELAKARADSVISQDIRMGLPEKIIGTDYSFIKLECVDMEGRRHKVPCITSSKGVEPQYFPIRNLANVFFFKDDYSEANLLLDTRMMIVLMDVPGATDTLQDFILYGIVPEDTNRDRRLDKCDEMHLYLSDLSGHRLRRITDETMYLINYKIMPDRSKIYFHAQNIPENRDAPSEYWEEELFVYDIAKGKMSSPFKVHQFISKAREIFQQ